MKLWLIAKSNMKKKKGNAVVLFLLIMIATTLIYSSVCILKNVSSFLDEKNESVNGAHLDIIQTKGFDKETVDIIKSEKHYKDYVRTDTITSITDVKNDNTDVDDDEESMPVCFNVYEPEHKYKICDYKITDEGDKWDKDSIILPYYLKVAKGYKTGQNYEIKIDDHKETFKIYGFVEDVMMSTPSNISMYECFINKTRFNDIKDLKGVALQDRFRVRLDNMNDSEAASRDILDKYDSKLSSEKFSVYIFIYYTNMRTGASMFISILMAVLAIFAVLILAIAVIVIRFSINMNIESNLSNIGILESMGYTSTQLRMASIVEYLVVTVAGIIAGLLAAFGVSGQVAIIVSKSVGVMWDSKIDVSIIIMAIAVVTAMVLLITLVSSLKLKKITPLDALRSGIHTHNFTRNHLPLHKSRLGLNSSIGIKGVLRQKKQNISIALIISLIVFSGVTIFTMYYNFVVEQDALINLVGLEKPDIMIRAEQEENGKGVDIEKKSEEFNLDDNVEQVLTYVTPSMTVKNKDKKRTLAAEVYSRPDKVRINTVISGRQVKHDNEVNLSNRVAKELGVKKGDTVMIESNNKEKEYIVVGITQRISNLGISLVMSQEGAERLISNLTPDTAYIYLKDTKDIKGEIERLKIEDKDNLIYTDFDEVYQNILKSFTSSLQSLCIVFIIVTIVVIALIIMLVIKMKLVREKQNIGVFKAIGFTTTQILWQNVMSFAPVISIGGLGGVIIGKLAVNKVCTLMLSLCGIDKAAFSIPFVILAGVFISTTILAFAVCIMSSLKVRKIEAYKMITEQ